MKGTACSAAGTVVLISVRPMPRAPSRIISVVSWNDHARSVERGGVWRAAVHCPMGASPSPATAHAQLVHKYTMIQNPESRRSVAAACSASARAWSGGVYGVRCTMVAFVHVFRGERAGVFFCIFPKGGEHRSSISMRLRDGALLFLGGVHQKIHVH